MAVDTPTSLVEQHDVPGATLALCSANGIVTRSIGWREQARTTRLEPGARFPIYSITKPMIATIVLQLVEAGAFALETPLRDLVGPRGSWLDPAITVSQTLNHTAGLPDYGGVTAYHDALRANPRQPWSDDVYLDCARELGPRFAAGEGWAYSNLGYMLLRLAIETTTGAAFADAVAARIANPLALAQTRVVADRSTMRTLTPGYSTELSEDGEMRDVTEHYHPGWVSHGLVASTAAETARFLFALLGGALLSPASLGAMLTPVRVPIASHPLFREPSYGLGVMIDPAAEGGILVGHGGGGPGFSLGVLGLMSGQGIVTASGMANSEQGDIGLPLAFRELRRMTMPST